MGNVNKQKVLESLRALNQKTQDLFDYQNKIVSMLEAHEEELQLLYENDPDIRAEVDKMNLLIKKKN